MTTAKATVLLTIEIDAGSSWSESCTVSQIHDQAARQATIAITDMIQQSNKLGARCKIIGKAEVQVITFPPKNKELSQ